MSTESATPTLPRLPAGALNRCVMVYSATCTPPLLDDGTIDPVPFWHRHRDTPALVHNAIRLYPTAFQEFIGEHFVTSNGPSPSLARSSPLHSIVGAIRPSSSHRKAVDERDRREQTLKVFLTKREDDPSLTFISTVFLPVHSAEGSPIAPLMLLPPFLSHQDLLSLPRSVAAGTSATLHQLIVGGAKTYSPTHIDYLGVAAASYLITGEKLWLITRPEQTHAFFEAFPPRESIQWTHLQRQKADVIERHQFTIVHQRAGDLFYCRLGGRTPCTT